VVFIDAIHVKVRDGQVANRPIYVALAVTVDGNRDILGLWAGDGGEGAKYWQQVLTEIKNRGVADVLMLVCDGLKGLPESVGNVWPQTIVQTCVVHLIRGSFRYAARQDWDKLARALRPIYTADTVAAAEDRFLEFTEVWGAKPRSTDELLRRSLSAAGCRGWSEGVQELPVCPALPLGFLLVGTGSVGQIGAVARRGARAS